MATGTTVMLESLALGLWVACTSTISAWVSISVPEMVMVRVATYEIFKCCNCDIASMPSCKTSQKRPGGLVWSAWAFQWLVMKQLATRAEHTGVQFTLVGLQDEVFHVPQTQRYCDGDYWSWDPKITTFPGTYMAGVAYASVIGIITGKNCSTAVLRSLNVLLSLMILVTVMRILAILHPRRPSHFRALWVRTMKQCI